MKTQMTKCDNPSCRSIGFPENRSKPYRPPYGWFTMTGYFMGCGPKVKIEVCSVECIEPTVRAILEEEERG